jgi:hypothetical protein
MPHGHHQPVNLGLLGSGFVAEFYMDGLRDVPGAHVVANSRAGDGVKYVLDPRGDSPPL